MSDYSSLENEFLKLLRAVASKITNGGGSLPDQTGQSGKYLRTINGVVVWDTVSGGSSITEQTLTPVNFGTNTSYTISSTKRVAYALYKNVPLGDQNILYNNQAAQTAVTIELFEVPDTNVIVGFYP